MERSRAPLKNCLECRWLDIQAEADRQTFWCYRTRTEVDDDAVIGSACADYAPARLAGV